MPSIQLDKILENISLEKALYKNEEKTKKEEEDAWKRVATNNNITLHEAKAIYNVLTRKYNTEKSKGNSTWKMYDIMQNIQEGSFPQALGKEKDENEGMIELMEVFEEEDSASEVNDIEVDKSNGSSGSKASGISARLSSGGTSQNRSTEVSSKKILNTDMNPPVSHKTNSQVFIPPNLQKVNLKPVMKKDIQVKRRADSLPNTVSPLVKRPTLFPSKSKLFQQQKSFTQAQSHRISASTEVEKQDAQEATNVKCKVESTTAIKTEPSSPTPNGYFDNNTDTNEYKESDEELKMPSNFFKHLCSSSRHEALGLYLANFLNRLDKSSARKLELKLLQTVTEFQSEHDN